mmetsp:Transcript_4415/g.15602  ORF Transcript_4415/g.15602 Transcript_4415/m.15602 type:complete len:232 (-) Transcript_4415:865-1560(-)
MFLVLLRRAVELEVAQVRRGTHGRRSAAALFAERALKAARRGGCRNLQQVCRHRRSQVQRVQRGHGLLARDHRRDGGGPAERAGEEVVGRRSRLLDEHRGRRAVARKRTERGPGGLGPREARRGLLIGRGPVLCRGRARRRLRRRVPPRHRRLVVGAGESGLVRGLLEDDMQRRRGDPAQKDFELGHVRGREALPRGVVGRRVDELGAGDARALGGALDVAVPRGVAGAHI